MFLSLDRLLLTFDIVILPSFDTAAMSRKKRWGRKRRISNVVVRRMVSLRFASFRDKLVAAAKNTNCTVFTDVCEAWTSKVSQVYFVLWVVIHVATPIWFVSQTCGNWECGKIHTKLGASKVFKCPACGHEEDRDAGAARKIYISWLYEAFQQVCCCCLVMFLWPWHSFLHLIRWKQKQQQPIRLKRVNRPTWNPVCCTCCGCCCCCCPATLPSIKYVVQQHRTQNASAVFFRCRRIKTWQVCNC